jgi:hypothetical protein
MFVQASLLYIILVLNGVGHTVPLAILAVLCVDTLSTELIYNEKAYP